MMGRQEIILIGPQMAGKSTIILPGATAQGFDWSAYFVQHERNRRLAKFMVYTDGKTPQETSEEILAVVH